MPFVCVKRRWGAGIENKRYSAGVEGVPADGKQDRKLHANDDIISNCFQSNVTCICNLYANE